DPVLKLMSKRLDGADDGPGRRVAQAAVGAPIYIGADIEQQVYIAGLAAAGGDPVQDLEDPARSLSAGRALAARLVRVELRRALHQQNNVGPLVKDHKTAGAEQRAVGRAALVVQVDV